MLRILCAIGQMTIPTSLKLTHNVTTYRGISVRIVYGVGGFSFRPSFDQSSYQVLRLGSMGMLDFLVLGLRVTYPDSSRAFGSVAMHFRAGHGCRYATMSITYTFNDRIYRSFGSFLSPCLEPVTFSHSVLLVVLRIHWCMIVGDVLLNCGCLMTLTLVLRVCVEWNRIPGGGLDISKGVGKTNVEHEFVVNVIYRCILSWF